MSKRRVQQGAVAQEFRFGLFDRAEAPEPAKPAHAPPPVPAAEETVSTGTADPTAFLAFEDHCRHGCAQCRLQETLSMQGANDLCDAGRALWDAWVKTRGLRSFSYTRTV